MCYLLIQLFSLSRIYSFYELGRYTAKFIKRVDPAQAKELNQKIAHNYLMYSNWYKE